MSKHYAPLANTRLAGGILTIFAFMDMSLFMQHLWKKNVMIKEDLKKAIPVCKLWGMRLNKLREKMTPQDNFFKKISLRETNVCIFFSVHYLLLWPSLLAANYPIPDIQSLKSKDIYLALGIFIF